ncbi:MAG: orotidine-5'-phosphate decarboxylase [Chloroflexi bacterium]|nr:MAG: orotidine-5'-phosphate decarboxylase [Chloroflexi bacterium TMED230]RZP13674.1 MAG: orotidine-5'-phosphate decarboxylase [Chloroflexota bacterium]
MSSFNNNLIQSINNKKTFLVVGLDPNLDKMPVKNIFDFNKEIIDNTYDLVVGYKPQLAYYESNGFEGLEALYKTIEYIKNLPEKKIIIGDCKRSDIDSTSDAYAKAMFEFWDFDAITIVPFFGTDGILPFTKYKDRGVFIVCKSSNKSGGEIQDFFSEKKHMTLYENIANISTELNYHDNVCLVMGATYPSELKIIREQNPNLPFLIPGLGHQKGDLFEIIDNSIINNNPNILINSARGIIYASEDPVNFGNFARQKVKKINTEINNLYSF